MMPPRCGRPMTRYEASNGPMPEEPSCGRPAGHHGPCRSAPAWARQMRQRQGEPQACECGCGELTCGRGPCKAGHHMRVRYGGGWRSGWPVERTLAPVAGLTGRVTAA